MLIINGRILRARLSKTVNHRVQQLIFKLHSYSCCLAAEHGKALFDYQRKYRDYVQWKARKKHLFCCDDTIAGGTEAVALKADGTVLSTILHTKMRENDLPWQAYRKALFVGDLVKEWFNVTELLKIFPGGLLGKRSDGTLCFAGAANSQYVHGQTICANTKCVLCDFAYADEQLSVFCLNEDGAIFYVGNSTEKQAELSSWRNVYGLRSVIDVVDFSIGNEFAFIHNGGKVTFISKDDDTQNRLNQATQHWREVIDISLQALVE